MTETKTKSMIRPLYGTLVFQPFAFVWCLITNADYWTSIGPFTIFAMIAFIPIYRYYDNAYDFISKRINQ